MPAPLQCGDAGLFSRLRSGWRMRREGSSGDQRWSGAQGFSGIL